MKIYFHPISLEHRTPSGHPECADRISRLEGYLKNRPIGAELEWRLPAPATVEDIARVHDLDYIHHIRDVCQGLKGDSSQLLDGGDTWAVRSSYSAALVAAGAGLEAVDQVMGNGDNQTFVMMRPPGHHARKASAMGFCLFGNVAVAAAYAREKHGVRRILVLDWDVHHGNGTQELFYGDSGVFFCSLHQSPHWPFSGDSGETGEGDGKDYTLNVPLPSGTRIGRYEELFYKIIRPRVEAFQPELILISAGFDAHLEDPLGGIQLETQDFGTLTRMVRDWAETYSEGRVVSFLEGGYNLMAMPQSVERHLLALNE